MVVSTVGSLAERLVGLTAQRKVVGKVVHSVALMVA